MSSFSQLVSEYLEATWQHNPVEATRKGIHRHDHLLPDNSSDAMNGWGATLEGFRHRFKTVDPTTLTHQERLDRRWALAVLENEIITDELELWRRSPQAPLENVGAGLHSLLISDFAPLQQRLESVLARLDAIPAYLDSVKRALEPKVIPPVWIQASIPNAQAAQQFVARDVPQAATDVPSIQSEIASAGRRAAQALADFEVDLRGFERLAAGDYAIGRDRFDRILEQFHMLDLDSQDLAEFGREWIERYETELGEVARQIDPDLNWKQALEQVKDDHPRPEDLCRAYEEETLLARRHCLEHDLITFPDGESCVLEWTPTFMRARTPIAQPWVSPAFEQGLSAKWYITPVDPDASPKRQRQHIRDNSWAWIRGIAMHEIYPGHHLQFAIAKQVATPLRLQFWSPVFGEGWGLYTEELFYETGLLAPPAMRLMQLRNGLWRAVRIIVDTGLHTRGMTLAESARWLSERALLEPRWAESETRYYTTRPTYPSSYLVGFSMLLDLREKWQRRVGTNYELKTFHDDLMSFSSLPLRMVEAEMLA